MSLWIIFNCLVLILLVLDLGVFHRKAHEIHIREAMLLSAFWIIISLLFNLVILYMWGHQKALEFLTGYLVEKSLSIDNLFVFLIVFRFFAVPANYQHKVLFWGILGALIMRGIFIIAGVTLITKFHWIIYIFGGILLVTGWRLFFERTKVIHPERNPVLKLLRHYFPVSKDYVGSKFIVSADGKRVLTPLFVVLVVIETTDIIFAVDSIPAILAITTDAFIVYSSNVFAILGLRALFFALSGIMQLFHYLHYGLSAILVFIGIKMILSDLIHIPIIIALAFIALTMAVSILASLLFPAKKSQG
ncbi:MAG: tellurium resistance protein TerC [Candidatus Fischerbacteria bacterium RBG_13_37_8]|uniref:Tellurium resistance protein TerC n=1 Tax=Candidatus Fischerbacteria bacterium RBG_13_37_8 TaxID=1817863 RepID=A0A1F5VW54_9BACT|nr:MAG: tellurium resistance protein TerC [Candidatus Fischerbacteria bacterium RBG_13_37_8]